MREKEKNEEMMKLESNHGLGRSVALLMSRCIELICQAACFVPLI